MEYQINNKGVGFPPFEESHPSAPLYYEGELEIKGILSRQIGETIFFLCYGYTMAQGVVEVPAKIISAAYADKFGRYPSPAELIGITLRVSRPVRVIERDGKRRRVRGYEVEIL